jgi:hypothetical protein
MSTSPAASQLRIPAHMLYSPGDAARADRSFVSGIRMTAHGTEGGSRRCLPNPQLESGSLGDARPASAPYRENHSAPSLLRTWARRGGHECGPPPSPARPTSFDAIAAADALAKLHIYERQLSRPRESRVTPVDVVRPAEVTPPAAAEKPRRPSSAAALRRHRLLGDAANFTAELAKAADENAAPKRPTISHSRRVKLDQSTSVLFGGSSDENRGQFTLGPTAPAGRFKMGVKIGHY